MIDVVNVKSLGRSGTGTKQITSKSPLKYTAKAAVSDFKISEIKVVQGSKAS